MCVCVCPFKGCGLLSNVKNVASNLFMYLFIFLHSSYNFGHLEWKLTEYFVPQQIFTYLYDDSRQLTCTPDSLKTDTRTSDSFKVRGR